MKINFTSSIGNVILEVTSYLVELRLPFGLPDGGVQFIISTIMLLARLIDFYSLIVLAAVIVSWIQLPPYHPVVKLLNNLTEPALAPIRKIVPPMGGLDFTPLVLLFLLRLIRGVLL